MSSGEVEGMITDIHRASVVDGPGIRTTVFLKGCPLSCTWCHNPETQAPQRELGYNPSLCIGCGRCVQVCPESALRVVDGKAVLDRARCVSCLACKEVCPTDALFVYGRVLRVDDVLHEVLKDVAYYRASGGGVTVSGGEPMMQAAFTLALLEACRASGVHTCLDTAGIGSLEDFERSLDFVDLYLFDYKATDPGRHQQLTGVSRDAVMRTLDCLLASGARVRLRCPIIPGVNDDDEHLQEIARMRQREGIDGVDLLPWHTMGFAKYSFLGRGMDKNLPASNVDETSLARYRAAVFGSVKRL